MLDAYSWNRTRHPDSSELKAFVEGQLLDTDHTTWISNHLETCADCRRIAETTTSSLEILVRTVGRQGVGIPLKISDGYELFEEIGRGASGVVYRALHRGMGRVVALKLLISGSTAHSSELARFQRESEALARLSHPNIVQVYDVGEQAGVPFLAMEWIDGESLAALLQRQEMTPSAAAELIANLADGIQHAHNHGVIHRDLKPQNVLVSNGVAKIVDFGLARFQNGEGFQTRTGHSLGTPSYMAPEQIHGDNKLGFATDIYGLGAILYEALVKRPPFLGGSPLETMQMVVQHEPIAVRSLRPSVPQDLAVICHRCLAKNPTTRFASAHDLAVDLRNFQAGKPICSRPASTVERGMRWTRRNPWPVAVAMLLITSFIALIAAQLVYQRRLGDQRDRALRNYQNARAAIWEMIDATNQESGFDIPRLNSMREKQIATALQLFETLANEEKTASAELDLAQIRMQFGSIQIGTGNVENGEAMLRQALSGFLEISKLSPSDITALKGVISSQVKMANGLQARDKYHESVQILQSTLPLAEKLLQQVSDDSQQITTLSWIRHNLGNSFVGLKEYAKAFEEYNLAADAARQFRQQFPQNDNALVRLADAQVCMGLCQMALDDPAADQSYQQAIGTLTSLLDRNPRDTNAMYSIATAQLNRSNISAGRGDFTAAIDACTAGIEWMQRALSANPDVLSFKTTLAMLYGNRAQFRLDHDGPLELAIADYRESMNCCKEPSIHDYCQTMLIRTLVSHERIEEAIAEAQYMDVSMLDDGNLFRYVASWGTICNASKLLSPVPLGSTILDTTCMANIQAGLQEIKRRNLLHDTEIAQAIREGDDFRSFRQQVGETYLFDLFQ